MMGLAAGVHHDRVNAVGAGTSDVGRVDHRGPGGVDLRDEPFVGAVEGDVEDARRLREVRRARPARDVRRAARVDRNRPGLVGARPAQVSENDRVGSITISWVGSQPSTSNPNRRPSISRKRHGTISRRPSRSTRQGAVERLLPQVADGSVHREGPRQLIDAHRVRAVAAHDDALGAPPGGEVEVVLDESALSVEPEVSPSRTCPTITSENVGAAITSFEASSPTSQLTWPGRGATPEAITRPDAPSIAKKRLTPRSASESSARAAAWTTSPSPRDERRHAAGAGDEARGLVDLTAVLDERKREAGGAPHVLGRQNSTEEGRGGQRRQRGRS